MVTVVAFGDGTKLCCIALEILLHIVPQIICRNGSVLIIGILILQELPHRVAGNKLEHTTATAACLSCIVSGKVGSTGVQGEQIPDVLLGLLRVSTGGAEQVKQFRMNAKEPFLSHRIERWVHYLELLRHDFECRDRLHVVCHIVVAAFSLLALFFFQ